MVLHRSIAVWRKGWGQSAIKLLQCSGFQEIYDQLEEGVGSLCTGVVVFHRSMVDWSRGWGLSALVSLHTSLCEM